MGMKEEGMGMKETVEQLAGLEVDLINRIWGCVNEEEDAFEAISRQLVDKPDHADLQNFINHALTGVLLAVAYFRFRETMKPFLSQKEMEEAFMKMTHAKAKNVIDHWHEPPEGQAE
ncbi:MAG: hypothetical protein ACYC5H_17340 [Methylovirgula sp.]